MKRRLMALACTLGVCAALALPAGAAYADVAPGSWYEAAVNQVTEPGYMEGVSDTQFAPDAYVTRATVVTVLWRMEGSPLPAATVSFGDVNPSAWYGQAAAWAKENGIANGDTRGDFKPEQFVTRQELAAFLTRYDAYRGSELAEGTLGLYSDAGEISAWAEESMAHAVGMGLLEGAGGKLSPTASATRAQLAVILQRLTTQAVG